MNGPSQKVSDGRSCCAAVSSLAWQAHTCWRPPNLLVPSSCVT